MAQARNREKQDRTSNSCSSNSQSFHPSKNAQSWMVDTVPKAFVGETLGDVRKTLERGTKNFSTIDYVYILDDSNRLLGAITVKEVFRSQSAKTRVEKLMKRDLVSVHPMTHQERVAYLALSHGLKSIPVVDKENHFLGVVPYDEILRIFNREVHEDTLRFGGIFHKIGTEYTKIDSSVSHMIKSRLPWLVAGVIGGVVAATIVGGFEDVLNKFIVLAAFMPVLVYLSDAVGTQSETLIIRSLALNPNLAVREYLLKELKITTVLALLCGLLLGLVGLVIWSNPVLGIIIGVSMSFSIMASVLFATLMPLVFRKFDMDPAVATGPFATLISDIFTILIYFSIAVFFMGFFGMT